jgi:hypothetical protein
MLAELHGISTKGPKEASTKVHKKAAKLRLVLVSVLFDNPFLCRTGLYNP